MTPNAPSSPDAPFRCLSVAHSAAASRSRLSRACRSLFAPFILLALFSSVLPALAFPPAPFYTIYGMVRDQVGQTVAADGAEVLLLKGGVVIGRAPISSSRLEQNYELNVRIDQNAPGTIFYSEKAIAANGVFSLVVAMNGLLFYPIEVSGNLTAGRGGERVRLDLTLGDDTDKDGLPDIWEMWQLYQAGLFPDANGKWDLSLINRDGDWDKDGVSDYLEYLAGTFAGDATSTFAMEIKQKLPASVRFEFFAVTGKSYVIESSLDMKTWTRVRFAVGAPAIGYEAHQATASGIVSAFTAPRGTKNEFYRLSVR